MTHEALFMYKVFEAVDDVSRYTAQRMLDKVLATPEAVLGLATGSTMEPVYVRFLALLQQHDHADISWLTTFNLDEYIGLGAGHPQSYRYYMCQHLFDKLCVPSDRVHLPDGLASDIEGVCSAYSEAIRAAGGMDLQLLGIGSNGHIGFNEPQTSFSSRTHVVALSERTRMDNGRFFVDQSEVPTHAITMGIQDILGSKEIVLVITGRHKAEIVSQLYHSAVDEVLPASALKLHDNVTVVLDREAAALLPRDAFDLSANGGFYAP